jgi:hypothetical protein
MCQEVFSERLRHILKLEDETFGIFFELRYVELQRNNGL